MDNLSMSNALNGQNILSNPNNSVTNPGMIPNHSQNFGLPSNGQSEDPNSATPAKRRPGRPKGSGKKMAATTGDSPNSSTNKTKRPVGRPRKDGFPAGSVGPRKSSRPAGRPPGRPRKSAPPRLDAEASTSNAPPPPGQPPNMFPFASGYFPFTSGIPSQWSSGFPSLPGPPMASLTNEPLSASSSADPALERGSWAELARNKPHVFLSTLLSSLATPNPVSSAGPSVEEAFKSHLVSLSPNLSQKQAAQTIPSLYSILKTFWLPSSPAYFSLTASASTARTPSEHRFLYWDPQPLVFNGIACPNCSVPLLNKGRIRSGPIKVYDLEKPFFIIGCEYVCKSPSCVANTSPEGRKFASTDSSILRSLPTRLKEEFPANLSQGDTGAGAGAHVWNWQAMGVSWSLWNMVRGCLQAGLGKDAIVQIIRSIQNGVPEEDERKEEEEEPEEEQVRDVAVVPETVPENSAQHAPADAITQTSTEAYHDAWKANTAVTESSQVQAGPSNSSVAMMQPSSSAPNTSPQFGLTPGGPYVTYPYTFLSYLQPQPPSNQPSASHSPTATSEPPPAAPVSDPKSIVHPKRLHETEVSEIAILEPMQKRTRHCCKCGSQDCKGKGGRSFCLNVCQDCGKLDCRGRNSRRPDKRCTEAWS